MLKRGENPDIILDPDTLVGRGDPKLIKRINRELRVDPEMEIPDKYKKYKDVALVTDYYVKSNLSL